ncbi:MAG: arsinothricin resistance N-acetyltransferase ArsN1 family B [Rhodanobacteraceae bacterium]
MNFESRDWSTVLIRMATRADVADICAIYNHYVATSEATFDETPASVDDMAHRIETITAAWPWLVAETGGTVIGYAYASQWKPRVGYRHTVESSVYLDPAQFGHGTGSALYASLLEILRQRGAHCVIAGIALPNAVSVALHEKFGFRKAAHFSESGIKFGRWIDVGYWQRMF